MKIPKHIAIIMDGNGRWAKKKSMLRSFGHKEGAKTLEKIIVHSKKIGIKYLTVYAFSTENWKRPKVEIKTIMNLFSNYLLDKLDVFKKENIRLVVSGSNENMSKDLIEKIEFVSNELKYNDSLVLNIAFNYGARKEIVDAVKKIVENNEEINEDNISKNLYNSFIPNPDLVIRTSGEFRLSNFLLWQIAYSEIYISNKLWPDFTEKDLDEAISNYNLRERRFGGINVK